MSQILVIGGAGYVGSHMVKFLTAKKEDLLVLDDLTSGFLDAISEARFIRGSILDDSLLNKIFTENKIDMVVNFASLISVGDSVIRPDLYYTNNLLGGLVLLKAMIRHDIRKLVFSSSAAIYGPSTSPISEESRKAPQSPYGRSKLFFEHMLEDFDSAFGLKSVRLRYFNAAGADESGHLGERHEPETHLIPIILQVASGRRRSISVFGTDYETPDGTCVRGYIHVTDLCHAHWLSIQHLRSGGNSEAFNLGSSTGYSVLEIIKIVEKVVQKPIQVNYLGRRPGDAPVLVASHEKIRKMLKWEPVNSDIYKIIRDAWQWEQKMVQMQE